LQVKKSKPESAKEPKTPTSATPQAKKKCNWEWFSSGRSPLLESRKFFKNSGNNTPKSG
jgi:hypothetical protein